MFAQLWWNKKKRWDLNNALAFLFVELKGQKLISTKNINEQKIMLIIVLAQENN